jgi:hypothetical protein
MSFVQSSALDGESNGPYGATPVEPLFTLLYESRARSPLSDAGLQQLVSSSQARNLREKVTSLLIYDEGRFVQWLEGPAEGVQRVWNSIRRDSRHGDIAVLEETPTLRRCFHNNPMALHRRRNKAARSSHAGPQMMAYQIALRNLVDQVFVPKLVASHAQAGASRPALEVRAAELVRLVLAGDNGAAVKLVNQYRGAGCAIDHLGAGLFEPAARVLGDLFLSDDCSDLDVTLGLDHLQRLFRNASFQRQGEEGARQLLATPRAVLVAPSPHEPHLLGSVIASEMFWSAGWNVSCEFPENDGALSQVVHDRWFDVLDLSLSSAYTREHRLPAMAASICAARKSSLNPALRIIADGRIFFDRPEACAAVGADASSGSALELMATATK